MVVLGGFLLKSNIFAVVRKYMAKYATKCSSSLDLLCCIGTTA